MLLALLAVTLGTGVATALGTLALQVGDDLARTLRAAGPNFVMRPEGAAWRPDASAGIAVARAGVALPESAVAALKSVFWRNNVLDAAPELDLALRAAGRSVDATGTWFDRSLAARAGPWRTGLAKLHPQWRLEGGWPSEDGGAVVLGRELARDLRASLGVEIALETAGRSSTAPIAAIVDAGGLDDRRMWLPLAPGQRPPRPGGGNHCPSLSPLATPEPPQPAPDPPPRPPGYARYLSTTHPSTPAHH